MSSLQEGQLAPVFNTKDQSGNPVSLEQFRGKKVVLYFYPKDDTPGCTKEACSFRDHYETLKSKGIVVLGVSTDSSKSHQKFIDKFDLPFSLLADEDKSIVQAYDVWGEKKFMGKTYMGTSRLTFLIDEEGKINHIIRKVDTDNSAQQVIQVWGLD